MKRKLDQNDLPAPEPSARLPTKADKPDDDSTFANLGLDPRLVQAVAGQRFLKPTLVQRRAIPLALDGRDVLCKAKTGSGKTAAYLLPVLAAILKRKTKDDSPSISALILVPTRELADQVFKTVEQLSAFCAKDVRAVKLSDKLSDAVQRSLLTTLPDVVIATPARAWHNVKSNSSALVLDKLSHLVLDEADLLLSYGYDEDLENLSWSIPKGVQTIMMSATLTNEVESMKKIFYRDNAPVLLDLEEADVEGEGVTQLVTKYGLCPGMENGVRLSGANQMFRCGEDEKFLLAYIIFKLRLVKGKCIIFVADVDRCYRLKLFFEQFGIRSCVLNSELPVNSRIHVVEEFNRNIYDIIIASDEKEVLGNEGKAEEEAEKEDGDDDDDADGQTEGIGAEAAVGGSGGGQRPKKRRKGVRGGDKEYGVSRGECCLEEINASADTALAGEEVAGRETDETAGIDFKHVAAVVNFDLPASASSYTHRIGRTGRAGQAGMALSFVVPKELYRKHIPTWTPAAEKDERVLRAIMKQQAKKGKEMQPYKFDEKQVEAFRYRMNDALRAVTKAAVREARTRELRQELLKSEKLKRYFEENPSEMKHLRHDGELRTARQQAHLRHIPDYLLPKDGNGSLAEGKMASSAAAAAARKTGKRRGNGRRPGAKAGRRGGDVLKTFRARRKTK